MEFIPYILATFAAFAAGFVNAIAGGGTLITFPVLVALGIPPVSANVTNTLALCPGFFGGTFSQRKDFFAQKQTLINLLPVSIAGGATGGVLLINTNESSFRFLIPYLILSATVLLAFQGTLKTWLITKTQKQSTAPKSNVWMYILIFFASVYGGYFGAGLGVILMAILGLVINENLSKLNVLKQAISFCINITAAIYFSFSGKAEWAFVFAMAVGAIAGGVTGGKLAGKINPAVLRWVIVSTGFIVSIIYFIK